VTSTSIGTAKVQVRPVSSSRVDLNLLQVLDAVLTEGSVARAARRLHVTSSAVSNALARLRLLVGDKLVTKKGRGIVPTPRALELAPILSRSLADLHNAIHAGAGFHPQTTSRRFTIALSDVGQILLPRIAALLEQTMPLARLRAVSIDSLVSFGGLSGFEVDVAIGPEEGGGDIHSEKLLEQHAVLICREGHPALRKRALAPALRHVAVEMAPAHGLRNLSEEAYAKAGLKRTIGVIVPTFAAATAVVAATDLVATVPASLFEAYGKRLRLRALPLPIPPLIIHTNLCWHERTHADPAAAAFRDVVRRAAGTTVPTARSETTRKLSGRKRG
jgi:DNA-binding transcriptional LysR family regulator